MKKYLSSLAVLLMSTALFTACDDNDNGKNILSVPVTNGAYVICGGNMSGNINGSLTYIDYATGTAAQNQFRAKNGRELGMTPNDALVYGDKMYIVVTNENTVEVVDTKTLASIKQIKMEELMGTKGVNPRHITAADGLIYVSTYGGSSYTYDSNTWTTTTEGNGYVAAIDTLTFSLKETYTAGSFPEGVAVSQGYLFVANSDYSAQTKASISMINLSTGKDSPLTDSQIVNPTSVAVAGSTVYVLDMGNYADIAAGVRRISITGNTVTTLFDATVASFVGSKIYACNCPWGTLPTEFYVYDIQTGSKSTYASGVDRFFYPNVITADPVTGKIYIASYNENADYPGNANYRTDGYVIEYSDKGVKEKEYNCGVGPNAIVFNMGYEEIEY